MGFHSAAWVCIKNEEEDLCGHYVCTHMYFNGANRLVKQHVSSNSGC